MKTLSLACLAAVSVLVTGCPHNDYTVELTPREKTIERRLVFYRADGTDTNGVPKYESFPSNELAAITALYPPGNVTREGERHFATGEFSGALPKDVGGAGAYNYLSTSLGNAAFYVERFRGNDDLAARARERLAAADQLADLVLGWSRVEFGREPGYKNLRCFLDTEFRQDLKNLTLYSWAGEISSAYHHEAGEEFIVRFGQYLSERGYLKVEDAAGLVQLVADGEAAPVLRLVQKFLAEKLGVPPAGPLPKPLALLTDRPHLEKSWDNYLAGTGAYRARLRQWQQEKKLKPDLEKPRPDVVLGDLVGQLVSFGPSGEEDHLTVRLGLTAAPDHTNGTWDEARRQVVWKSNLESTNRLPAFCYASWSHPSETFQREHFGRVILNGDELLKYSLWRSGLAATQSDEWEKLLLALHPGDALTNQLAAFQFSGATPANSSAADFGKDLIKSALEHKP